MAFRKPILSAMSRILRHKVGPGYKFCLFSSHRYYQLFGMKPVLSLKSCEGALLSPDDLLSELVSENEEVRIN